MTKMNQLKSTMTIVLPLMASFLAQKGMQFVDTMMMGWVGPQGLASGAIGTAIFFTVLVFGMGTLSAVGVFVARAKGANNKKEIIDSLQNGILLAMILSALCMPLMWLIPHLIKKENKDIIYNATLLLHGLSFGLPGYLLFLVFREFVSAFSLTRIVMFVTVSSIPLTFLLNYVFIYGKFGFPSLGVSGIGYAGAIVMWFMFFFLFFYSLSHRDLKSYLQFRTSKFSLSMLKDMLFIGVPSGTFFVLESMMFLSAVMMMGYFGVSELASFQIAMQCASIAYAIPISLSMATALQVSHAMGANELSRLRFIAIQNFGLGILFSMMVAICFVAFPNFFIKLFLESDFQHAETIKIASAFLIIAAYFLCFDAIQAIATGMLRGLKDTFVPMVLSIGCFWAIGIASSYYFAFHTGLGPKGIWYGLTLGICSLGIVLIIRLLQKIKYISTAKL